MGRIEFWYDFASTYSYLSAMRIETLAASRGVAVDWRPFLLGPIFKAQGWETSPFNLYPAKGRYMVRDLERLAAGRGLGFRLPDPFPQPSLRAARVAVALIDTSYIGAFTRALFAAQFSDGVQIADVAAVRSIVEDLGLNGDQITAASETSETKARLRALTDEASAKGIFGAPTFCTPDREIFWGDDRLENALEWLAGKST